MLPDSAQVWPSIPQGGASTLFDFAQVDNTIGEIIVKMFNSGSPISDQGVTISTEWIEGSGGHNHSGGNDLAQPPQNIMGWIVDIAEADSAQGRIETVTNEDGEIRLRYRAPEFGGKIRMVAQTNINRDTLFADDTLAVKVPGLVLLPNGNNLSKVGGTPRHHGPRVDSRYQNNRSPDNNHFGTQEFVDSLISLANNWANLVASDSEQDDRQVPLNINDLSLPNGGKFDLEGRWLTRLHRAAHDYHRVGRDADIRTTRKFPIGNGRNGVLLTRLLDGNGTPVLDTEGNEVYVNRAFQRQIILHGANRKSGIHGSGKNEHYHVYFY
ncbi:MAG: hypothetical protein JJ953_12455 [Gracilimonas sp.]|nr:hypothetical protein [Gracilimonas sp.]MBO6586911.1 hypothetical protein [Gracilimonas sp.]MBO6614601.1 hypothetical protein [Gracilimonas sp.]